MVAKRGSKLWITEKFLARQLFLAKILGNDIGYALRVLKNYFLNIEEVIKRVDNMKYELKRIESDIRNTQWFVGSEKMGYIWGKRGI